MLTKFAVSSHVIFQVMVLGKEGEPLAPLAAEVIKVIDTLKAEGIDTDVLAQAKAIEEADMFFSLESVSGKVSQLASNQTFYQTPIAWPFGQSA